MDDTSLRSIDINLRVVASLQQSQYATDWNGIGIQEKGFFTSLRRTVLSAWENRDAAMTHLEKLVGDAIVILNKALREHTEAKKTQGFAERVKDPNTRAFRNVRFIHEWINQLVRAIGTRERGIATQYIVYASSIECTSRIDQIVALVEDAVLRTRALFPESTPSLLIKPTSSVIPHIDSVHEADDESRSRQGPPPRPPPPPNHTDDGFVPTGLITDAL